MILPAKNIGNADISEMLVVLQDPHRLEVFKILAEKSLMLENIDFILSVLKFKAESEVILMRSSMIASEDIKIEAKKIFKKFLEVNCFEEVNVSSNCRNSIIKNIDTWSRSSIMTKRQARYALEKDSSIRLIVFEAAFKEILMMLYQVSTLLVIW